MVNEQVRRGIRANSEAERLIGLFDNDAAELKSEPRLAQAIEAMTRGIPFHFNDNDRRHLDMEKLIRIGDRMGEIAVCDLWKNTGLVALDLHPSMAAELYRSTITEVPGHLFERLPYINPLVVLPEPWPVRDPKTKVEGLIQGFFIFGWNERGAFCDTNAEMADGIGVMFIADTLDRETGEPDGYLGMIIPLPTFRKKFSIKDAAKFVEEFHGIAEQGMDLKTSLRILRPILGPALSVLIYLCCDNRDVEDRPLTRNARKRAVNTREPFWVEVGHHIGPALHEAKRRLAGRPPRGPSLATGVEQSPQQRCGHHKTIWFGPGKTKSTNKWISPYWTKKEELEELLAQGGPRPTMIVPVNPQRHDPLRRRGLK